MAIAIDKASLGTNSGDPGSTTIALTTSQAVASSGFIVLSVGWFNTGVTLSSVSGGGLTWTIDKQGQGPGTNMNAALVSAQAASGLASSTSITATFSASAIARMIGGTSFTGVATSTPVDTTDGPKSVTPATTAWTTNSVAISAGSVLIATAYAETTNSSSTVTSPSIEALDWNYAGGVTQTTCYRIESSASSYTVAGTWATSMQSDTVAVAYLAAAGGGGGGGTTQQTLMLRGVGS